MITKNLSLVVCTILLVSFAMMILGTSYSVAIPADNGKISLQKNVGQYKAYSHKIDARILDQIGKSNLKKSGPFNINIDQSGKFWVYLNLDSNKTVPSKTIDVTGKDNNVLVTKLTLDEINQISKSNNVKSITLPDMAVFPTVVSEGVAFSHADLMQQSGYAGNGTVVAVIDDSFFTNDPEIKNNIMSSTLFDSTNLCSSSISCGKASGHSHGTAVAQTVVDMAPGVKLRLYVIGNSVDFNNAIDDAIAHHVNIITTSVVFPGLGGNGAGGFRDGTSTVAQKVNQAVASGIFVVTSAGNEGNGHWQGVYKISPITPSQIGLLSWQSVMDFRPTAAGVQRACLPVTDNGYPFIATWNAWPTTSQDYDFFLYDSTMTSVLAISEGDQLDFPSAPIEGFNGVGGNGKACLVVASFSSTQNHSFHIYGSNGANPFDKSVNSRFGSIETPADANGSFTAGAVYYANNSLENFSSSGPTDDARLKPEICGPDGTTTDQSAESPFFGTSAAAPHVAGAAALVLQKFPTLTVNQLKQTLVNSAMHSASYSKDNLCGANSGALSLLGLVPPNSINILTVNNTMPRWIVDTISVSGNVTGPTLGDTVTLLWGDGKNTTNILISSHKWGPVNHAYGLASSGSSPSIKATLKNSTNQVMATSAPVIINVKKHHTSLALKSVPGVMWGKTTTFRATLKDIDNVGIGIPSKTIHFNGTGVIPVGNANTNGTGMAMYNGTAPLTVKSGWTVFASFASDPGYLSSITNASKYTTSKHTATLTETLTPSTIPANTSFKISGLLKDSSFAVSLANKIINFTTNNTVLIPSTFTTTNSTGGYSIAEVFTHNVNHLTYIKVNATYNGNPLYSSPIASKILKITVNNKPQLDTITLNPITSVLWGKNVTVTGKLTNSSSGAGIGGKIITFAGNGSTNLPSVKTNPNGTFSAMGPSPNSVSNKWQVAAKFAGDSTFMPGSSIVRTYNSTIHTGSLTMNLNPVSVVHNKTYSISGILKDSTLGVPLNGKTISITSNNTGLIPSTFAVTNSTGGFSKTGLIAPNVAQVTFIKITAKFSGGPLYSSPSISKVLKIT